MNCSDLGRRTAYSYASRISLADLVMRSGQIPRSALAARGSFGRASLATAAGVVAHAAATRPTLARSTARRVQIMRLAGCPAADRGDRDEGPHPGTFGPGSRRAPRAESTMRRFARLRGWS